MCQGFGIFIGFLHHFVLAKLATSSIRVMPRALRRSDTNAIIMKAPKNNRYYYDESRASSFEGR